MKIIEGKFNNAIIYTDNFDESTSSQIIQLLDQDFTKDLKIRIMPDCHAGMGCVIGTTMTVKDKIVPNLVGVDIGCGMLTVKLGRINLELVSIDKFISENIPYGMNVHNEEQEIDVDITKLRCWNKIDNHSHFYKSMGSLGGGNHFIEIDEDDEKNKYLIIHTGSRNLGLKVANYYQSKAIEYHHNKLFNKSEIIEQMIKEYKKQGREKEIQGRLKEISQIDVKIDIPNDLCYLEGELFNDYLHDMEIVQRYASGNRKTICESILIKLKINLAKVNYFETIHNYINMNDMILRKGAISAYKDEMVLIPINMRDGCIIAKGKGNKDFNFSAPHGAGRILSRLKAKDVISLKEFKDSMKGIYSTTISKNTIDESPFVYKPMEEIIENIKETVEIIKIIKPIYNFKAQE
jgi:RNA-splicing ligase RtcB